MTLLAPSVSQILVTGSYRTGSEYLTKLIGNHPDIVSSMYVLNFIRNSFGRYDDIKKRLNYKQLVYDAAVIARVKWGKKIDIEEVILNIETRDVVSYGLIYDVLMTSLFLKNTVKKNWLEKTQLVWTKIPHFLDMMPNAKVVHIIRDPRATLASFREFTNSPKPSYLGSIFNSLSSMQYAKIYSKSLPQSKYILLRYEDLCENPDDTLKSIFERWGFSSDHDISSQKNWVDNHGQSWEINSSFLYSNPPKRNKVKERWKSELSESEILSCQMVCGNLMEEFGYRNVKTSKSGINLFHGIDKNENLHSLYLKWLISGKGSEAFPSDPMNPDNWSKSNLRF